MAMTFSRDGQSRQARRITVLCWFAYMLSYMGRYNFGTVIGTMTQSGSITRADAGIVSSLFFFAYMIGQIVHTFWLAKVDPVRVVPVALVLSALLNALMPCVGTRAMFAVWFLNGIVQSALWPCMVRVLTERLPEERVTRGMVAINTTTAVGTTGAYLLTSLCLRFARWQYAFFAPSALMALVAVVWLFGMRGTSAAARPASVPKGERAAGGSRLGALVSVGFLCALFASMGNGFLRDGIVTWLPTYIQDSFHVSASAANTFSVIVPIAQFAGPFLAQKFYAPFSGAMGASTALYLLTALLIGLMLLFPGSLLLSCACFALCSMVMTAVNTVLISLYPLKYGKRNLTALVSTSANACVYVGSMAATSAFGMASETFGWNYVVALMLGVAVAACAVCLFASFRERGLEQKKIV